MLWSRRLVCLARRGHDYHTRFEEKKAFLECAFCGSRTVGWHLDVAYRPSEAPLKTLRLTFADDVEPQPPSSGLSPVPPTPLRLELDPTSM